MRGAILRKSRIVAVSLAFCLALAFPAFGQGRDKFEGWCDSLQNATSPDLVQFLNAVAPDHKNSHCVAWTIRRLGREHYEPAIQALVRLLDFRRPATEREKLGFTDTGGIAGIWDLYPAVGALDLIGKNALPGVLSAIEADSTSSVARENALAVWMEIYRQTDGQPKAVALLKQEETKNKDEAIKQRLTWAVQKALTQCNPPEETACRQAAGAAAP
jgi:hypothetical protein